MLSSKGPGRHQMDLQSMATLRVDNLTNRTTAEDLRRQFEKYGSIGDVYIPKDKGSGTSKGYALVRYYDLRDAEDARESMDGRKLDGHHLQVTLSQLPRQEAL